MNFVFITIHEDRTVTFEDMSDPNKPLPTWMYVPYPSEIPSYAPTDLCA
ncbi:MAG: hypothetical protein QOJ81_1395 [Chloroflexota bacterium]|nr:hypothetical protein [Chloroflexota bacterium]